MAALVCAGCLLTMCGGNVEAAPADPEFGRVADGTYTNDYFRMSYPLPPGWSEDLEGPAPSHSGYYVLSALRGPDDRGGTILIAAQDQFFGVKGSQGAAEAAREFIDEISQIDGMTTDRGPLQTMIAGRTFSRVDFSGTGLYRALLVTEIRCHLVSFNLTTRDPSNLARLLLSLNDLSLSVPAGRSDTIPACVKDYVTPEHLLSRVEAASAGPKFTVIPARIIIGTDGWARHVHVIRASAKQRASIISALTQWRLEPLVIDGKATEVETGLTFRF
jgi:hypothetical protein